MQKNEYFGRSSPVYIVGSDDNVEGAINFKFTEANVTKPPTTKVDNNVPSSNVLEGATFNQAFLKKKDGRLV